jgi:alpha-L-glutamate ligase-like protein
MSIFDIYTNRKLVLGQNQRNLFYIRKYNSRSAKEIADDKILTKEVLSKANVPTPKLITIINNRSELNNLDLGSLPNSFVIKPVHGIEGRGIEIFYNRDKQNNWIKGDGSKVSPADFYQLALGTLDGRYSLHQEPDKILIEERVQAHKKFKYYTYKGTPDVRIIVFNRIPIMSYIRIPTKESEGKANLALGALGIGIDMAKGVTTTAISGKSGGIEYIPGTKLPVSGLQIPYWDKILRYAIEAEIATDLNFAAVDFLIDRELGPMVVELNARPGLSIQLANDDGLRWRLRKALGVKVTSVDKGIRLAKDLFGGEIESNIELLSGKDVIGIYENVTLQGPIEKKEAQTKAKIDTGADSTSIDIELAAKIGYGDLIKELESRNIPEDFSREEGLALSDSLADEFSKKYDYVVGFNLVKSSHGSSIRPVVKITLSLQDTEFETKATLFDRSNMDYPVIIGRKSLGKFLVDPSKITLSS